MSEEAKLILLVVIAFCLFVGSVFLYLTRDTGLVEKYSALVREHFSLMTRVKKLEDSNNSLRTTLMSYQSNFEEDFNDVSQRCEQVTKENRRITNNQSYLKGRIEALQNIPVALVEAPLKKKLSIREQEALNKVSQQVREF